MWQNVVFNYYKMIEDENEKLKNLLNIYKYSNDNSTVRKIKDCCIRIINENGFSSYSEFENWATSNFINMFELNKATDNFVDMNVFNDYEFLDTQQIIKKMENSFIKTNALLSTKTRRKNFKKLEDIYNDSVDLINKREKELEDDVSKLKWYYQTQGKGKNEFEAAKKRLWRYRSKMANLYGKNRDNKIKLYVDPVINSNAHPNSFRYDSLGNGFIEQGWSNKFSYFKSKYHNMFNRKASKFLLKDLYDKIAVDLQKSNISDFNMKTAFNYVINHIEKNQKDNRGIIDARLMRINNTELINYRNRKMSALYYNIVKLINETKHIDYKQKRYEDYKFSGHPLYQLCNSLFGEIVQLNGRINKVLNVQKSKDVNIFNVPNLYNLVNYADFPSFYMDLTETDVMQNVLANVQNDSNNVVPFDIFYYYGIPMAKKEAEKFDIKGTANALKDLYNYQVILIDSLRFNRQKTITNIIYKEKSLIGDHKELLYVVISHPMSTRQSFYMPVPPEFYNSHNEILSTSMINTYLSFMSPANRQIADSLTKEQLMKWLTLKGYKSFFSYYIYKYLESLNLSKVYSLFLKFVFQGKTNEGNFKTWSINIPIMSMNNFEKQLYDNLDRELMVILEYYDADEHIVEIYIIDIIIQMVTDTFNVNNITAYGRIKTDGKYSKKNTYEIQYLFAPIFPDLHICLFECFCYMYFSKQFNIIPNSKFAFDEIKNRLNIKNWVDFKVFLLNFLFSMDVIPSLKEAVLTGNVKETISIMDNYYDIPVSLYNVFENSWCISKTKTDIVFVWSNFHVYITNLENINKYMTNLEKPKVAVPYVFKQSGKGKVADKYNGLFLALDIETLTDDNYAVFGNQRPYLICIVGDSRYRHDFFSADTCVSDFIKWLPTLFELNHQVVIFTHNGNKFDFRFLISELMSRYYVTTCGSHNKITSFSVHNVVFMDFFLFFPTSLNNLSKSWLNGQCKDDFNHANIFYHNYIQYKESAIKYCYKDCDLLLNLVMKFFQIVFSCEFTCPNTGRTVNIGKSLDFYTAPQLAIKIYKNCFFSCQLKGSTGPMYFTEKASYFGGMCVVYQKYSLNKLICYDINSCYPASMLREMPAVFECKVEPPNGPFYILSANDVTDYWLYNIDYLFPDKTIIANLPSRIDDEIIYLGDAKDRLHWGNEIAAALKLGASIRVNYYFKYKPKKLFEDYIQQIYSLRLKAKRDGNVALVDFYKLLMNSLYGKFGQRLFNQKNIISTCELNELLRYYEKAKTSVPKIVIDNESNEMVFNTTEKNAVLGEMDIANKILSIKLLDKNCVEYEYQDLENYYNQIGSLVRFSAFITAQARCLLLEPFISGKMPQESLYYTDTDSIFVDREMPSEFVSDTELGKFKCEYKLENAYFLSPKMYVMKIQGSDQIKMKMKGIPSKYLDAKHYEEIINKGFRDFSFTRFVSHFSEVHVGQISKRVSLKSYKRNYYDQQHSFIWNNYDRFFERKKEVLHNLAEAEKLHLRPITINNKKVLQQETRRMQKNYISEMIQMTKNNYVFTWDNINDIITTRTKEDYLILWDSFKNIENEPMRKLKFIYCILPFYNFTNNGGFSFDKEKFKFDKLMEHLFEYIMSGDYSKDNYYEIINKFLTSDIQINDLVGLDQFKIKPGITYSDVVKKIEETKVKCPTWKSMAIRKSVMFECCIGLNRSIHFTKKESKMSPLYNCLMEFYWKYFIEKININ